MNGIFRNVQLDNNLALIIDMTDSLLSFTYKASSFTCKLTLQGVRTSC